MDPQTVPGAAPLVWGVKESFRRYVTGSGGTVTIVPPTWTDADGFAFPLAAAIRHPSGDLPVEGELRYAGEVSFEAHGGMLAVQIADPWLVFGPDGAELTVVDPDYGADRSHRVRIAWVDTRTLQVPSGDALTEAPATLTVEGSRLLGDVYPVGTVLDPVRFGIPADGSP